MAHTTYIGLLAKGYMHPTPVDERHTTIVLQQRYPMYGPLNRRLQTRVNNTKHCRKNTKHWLHARCTTMHESKRIKVYASPTTGGGALQQMCPACALAALNRQGRDAHSATTGVVHAKLVHVSTEAFHLNKRHTDRACPCTAWNPLLTLYSNHHRPMRYHRRSCQTNDPYDRGCRCSESATHDRGFAVHRDTPSKEFDGKEKSKDYKTPTTCT